MKVLLQSKLGRRLLMMFLLLALPVIAAGWFAIHSATAALDQQTHAALRAASDGAEAQLREFLLNLERVTKSLGRDLEIRESLRAANGQQANMAEILERVRETAPETQEVLCLNPEGLVVASSTKELVDINLSGADYFERGQRLYCPGDVTREEITGRLQWRMSAPVIDTASKRLLGVVALGIDPAALSFLTSGQRVLHEGADTQSFRIGLSGETYIVNRSGFLLTTSRFTPDSILRTRVNTEPIRVAIQQGKEMIGDYPDYRGVSVNGASAILRDLGWVLITEIDFRQAFAPIRHLRDLLIGVGLGVALVASLAARRFMRSLVDPLRMVNEADQALASGDERLAIVQEQALPENEIGDFVRLRNARVKELVRRQRELISEQKARAQAAVELERLSYSMVHDMRAPLRAIIMFGDLLREQAEDRLSAAERGHISRMKTACLRMDHLICDLLTYSSLLHTDMKLSAIKAPDLVRQVIEENEGIRTFSAKIEVESTEAAVSGNEATLRQCFSSLLDNAFRYHRPGVDPEVRVKTETRKGWVRTTIEDNGTGMPKEFHDRVFGLFQKGTNSSEGTGISLALVRLAVERMGGQVGVASQEGIGSCFWIELKPAEQPAPATNV
jgi:signal transduction histidine kinase